MVRNSLAALLPALTLAGFVAGCSQPNSLPEDFRPNVLVILIDGLRADRLGVEGYTYPPHIDALAEEGVFFTAAMAHSTWTKPSIATIFTSLYPSQHGIQRASIDDGKQLRTEVLDESLVTVAERLRDGGYATGAVINQVHLRERFGFAQGFDSFQDFRGRDALKLNRQLEQWLASLGSLESGPFFAYLHYLDLHWPYTVELPENEGVFGSTEMKSEPPVSGKRFEAWANALDDADDLRALEARYDHEVAYTDAAVGDMVARLRELGLFEDTVIIVTSDHGEAFKEHDQMGHGFSPYEEVLRIPLVVRLPEAIRFQVGAIAEPVGLIDLLPTLVELGGLDAEPQAQGDSFVPLLLGNEGRERVFCSETYDAFSARTRDHKLIWFTDDRLEFYDLAADPLEGEPVPGPCEGPCRELAQQLRSFRELMLTSRESNPAGTAELEKDEIESLRALGYLD
jgi:arylsulfatase A-like enzyme